MITKTSRDEKQVRYHESKTVNSPVPTSASTWVAFALFAPSLDACSFTTSFSPFWFILSSGSSFFSGSISLTPICTSRSELEDLRGPLKSCVACVKDVGGMGSWFDTREKSSWRAKSKWVKWRVWFLKSVLPWYGTSLSVLLFIVTLLGEWFRQDSSQPFYSDVERVKNQCFMALAKA